VGVFIILLAAFGKDWNDAESWPVGSQGVLAGGAASFVACCWRWNTSSLPSWKGPRSHHANRALGQLHRETGLGHTTGAEPARLQNAGETTPPVDGQIAVIAGLEIVDWTR
jgi:hypothetical protein